ncbi:MAG: ABC transporter permease [Planctomycetes bacterium]|nr:ABC transporter permease [Planctomycetota bacterium]
MSRDVDTTYRSPHATAHALRLNLLAVYLFLYAPILLLVVFSFNASRVSAVWRGFTLEWYGKLLRDRDLWNACWNSLVVAGAATVVATTIGTLAALALERYRFPGRTTFTSVLYLTVIAPEIIMAISLLLFYARIQLELGLLTIIIAHVAFNISFVTLVVQARLRDFDWRLTEAAMDLGATPASTFFRVTLPLIFPGVLGGALLAFTLSIDDFVITFFTAGPRATTLPLRVYSMVKFGVTPEINALSTLLLLNSIVLVLLSLKAQRYGK